VLPVVSARSSNRRRRL